MLQNHDKPQCFDSGFLLFSGNISEQCYFSCFLICLQCCFIFSMRDVKPAKLILPLAPRTIIFSIKTTKWIVSKRQLGYI